MQLAETTRACNEFRACVASRDDLLRKAHNYVRAHEKLAEVTEQLLSSCKELTDQLVNWGRETIATLIEPGKVELADRKVRDQVTCCAEIVSLFLQQARDSWQKDDHQSAQIFSEQAGRVADVLYDIQRGWPWANVEDIDPARGDRDRGELMDLETFVDGLRGV